MGHLTAISLGKPTSRICVFVLALLAGLSATSSRAAVPFPLLQGEAATTELSGLTNPGFPSPIDPNEPVVTTLDIRNPAGATPPAPLGDAWLTAPFYRDPSWTAANLGQVYGITLDDDSPPNIYVTAASVYILHVNTAKTGFETGMYGPLGPGGIYQINGATGAICPYASISNSGAGLGNIAYNPVNQRIDVSSIVPFTFDHGLALPTAVPPRPPIPDIPTAFDFSQVGPSPPAKLFTPGFTPLGRRVWGLQFFDNRLYYSVWTSDARGAGTSPPPNEIWSVGLLAGGFFNAADVRLEKTIPPLVGRDYSDPVSDIAFSAKGKMLVAERVRHRDWPRWVTHCAARSPGTPSTTISCGSTACSSAPPRAIRQISPCRPRASESRATSSTSAPWVPRLRRRVST